MNRWNRKRKHWLDNHSRKLQKRKYKKKKRYSESREIRSTVRKKSSRITLVPPSVFSITDNTEETMKFYMEFADEINNSEHGTTFWVDSSHVEYVTVDALIYLIAILQNDKTNIRRKYYISGNYPLNENANKVYQESGFNNYVNSSIKKLPTPTEKMHIIGGVKNESEIARDFCIFVMNCLGISRVDVMPLQTILIELMSNVYHHAYEKHSFMAKRWYMYAEYVDDYIQCVFVDTGYGIAKTVRKNFREWIKQAIGFKPKDAKLIESAFNGDFRTATNQPFRGNGLNHVKNKVLSGLFDRFEVYSGGGMVGIEKNGDKAKMTTVDYKNTLYGTLFVFTIRKVQNDSN